MWFEMTATRLAVLLALRVWRIVNTTILVFAFFSPWVRGCRQGEVFTGAAAATLGLQLFLNYVMLFVMSRFNPEVLVLVWLFGSFTLLAYATLLHIGMNTLRALFPPFILPRRWYLLLFLVSVSPLALMALGAATAFPTQFVVGPLLRGYWLLCLGLFSSALLEAINFVAEDVVAEKHIRRTAQGRSPPLTF